MTPQTFTIKPAVLSDVPRLADIHILALKKDPAVQSYGITDEEFHAKLTPVLTADIKDPSWTVLKVVLLASAGDAGSDETIASFIAWQVVDVPRGEASKPDHPTDDDKQANGEKGTEFSFNANTLGAHVRQDTIRAQQAWTSYLASGTKYSQSLYLICFFTDPVFERRGMGAALLRECSAFMEERKMPGFVKASMVGRRMYEREGWRKREVLEVELGEWDGRRRGERYLFAYLVRMV